MDATETVPERAVTTTASFVVELAVLHRFDALCALRGLRRSGVVRDLVHAYVNEGWKTHGEGLSAVEAEAKTAIPVIL